MPDALAGVAIGLGAFGAMSVVWAGVIYVLARWRTQHEVTGADKHLGIKTLAGYFKVMSFQVLLAGAFLFLYSMFTKAGFDVVDDEFAKKAVEETREQLLRVAAGLMVPGGVLLLAHMALERATNASTHPIVPRLFAGWNLLLTGGIGFWALIFVSVLFFQEAPEKEAVRLGWAFLLVYVGAWIALTTHFMLAYVRQGPADWDETNGEGLDT